MRKLIAGLVTAAAALGLSASLALAHTSVAETSPKSGSTLEQSPPVIEITFKEAARLTSVVVVEAGKPERKLEFAPKDNATTFKISNPNLVAGKNEIHWKALSKDGHVASGSIVLTISPAAAKSH